MRLTAMLLVACACITNVSVANAAPFELEWSAPEGCPSRERMLSATRARLGEDDPSAPPELFVRGSVTIEGPDVVVDLRVADAAGADLGERHVRFEDRRCDAIEGPSALVLAMMLGVARPRQPEDDRRGPPPPVPAKPRRNEEKGHVSEPPLGHPRRDPPSAAPASGDRSMTVGLSAVASRGGLPTIGIGGALRWTATIWAFVVLGVEGSFETASAVRAGDGEASFRRLDAAALAGVRVLRSRKLEIAPLLEGRWGLLSGDVTGLSSTHDANSAVAAVGVGLLGRVALGDALRLEVLPDVRAPLARDEFQVRRGTELIHVHRPALVEGRLSLGLAWEFR